MAAAIAAFRDIHASHKAAIIGAMRELGDASAEEHRRLVDALAQCNLDWCLLVGSEFEGIALSPNMTLFHTTDEAASSLRDMCPKNNTILVKGSNSNRLWTLVNLL